MGDIDQAVAELEQASAALADAAEEFSDDDSEDGPYRRIRALQDQVDDLIIEVKPDEE